MTVKQVSEYLHVYKLARSGFIPSLKIAGQWRFKKEVIDKWISDTELLAILLRVGSNGKSAVDLARERKGLGIAKITQIKAAIEIGKRFFKEKSLTKIKVKTSKDIVFYPLFEEYEKRNF